MTTKAKNWKLRSLLAMALTSQTAISQTEETPKKVETAPSTPANETTASPESQLFAQNRSSERIQIVGSRIRLDDQPGSAQSLEANELDRHSYSDVNRVLRQLPGINLMEEDGFGLFPNIGLRGTRLERSGNITLMEDGVLIAPAPYSASAAYYFPSVSRMSRIEVRKGSSAIKYGPYTTGGAINLLSTPIPNEKGAAHARLMYGSYGSSREHVWIGATHGQFGWLIEADNSKSDGFKKLDSDTRVSENMPRPNTGFDKAYRSAKLRWNSGESSLYQEVELKLAQDEMTANETYLGLTLEDFKRDPFRRYSGSQRDQMNTDFNQVQVRHYIEPSENIDVTTTIYQNTFARNWYKLQAVQNTPGGSYTGLSGILSNPSANANAMNWILGVGGNDVLGNVRANNRKYLSQGIQSNVAIDFDTGSIKHELEFGIRHHQDEEDRKQWQDSYRMSNQRMILVNRGSEQGAEGAVDSRLPGSQENRIVESTATALYLQDTIYAGDWIIAPGLRFEDIKISQVDYFTGDAPRRNEEQKKTSNSADVLLGGLGVTYKVEPNLFLIAGAHQGFAPGSWDKNVPEEKSMNYELGARYQLGEFRAEVVGFMTQYENLIGTCTASSGGGCNIGDRFDGGKVDVHGLETMILYDLGRAQSYSVGIPVRLGYSLTNSKFKSSFSSSFADWGNVESGDKLPQIPESQIHLGLGVEQEKWNVHLNANFVSETRSVAGKGPIPESQRIDSRYLLDLSAEVAVHAKGRVFGTIENLTDETYAVAHSPAGVRPGAPRMVWAGAKIDL